MPYKASGRYVMQKKGRKWVRMKLHRTAEKAKAHARALNANVKK